MLQRLGAGQTSVVWLARHERSGRAAALKLLRSEAQTNAVLRRMFENEVQITLKLDHPNVVRAFDGHPTGVEAFLALEYCEGGTLDQLLLEQGRMPASRALQLVRDVAAGLAHTHGAHVLHRDVKPANVFLDGSGRAKLGDFGTGTFAIDDATERVGTAFYMAPEIFQGSAPTMQSDVYSLGVLAYEVLAGERPFQGETYDALMVAHLTALPRDLRRVRPDLPAGVSAVIAKAMSRDATRRYQTVEAFAEGFRVATGDAGPAPTPAPDPGAPVRTGRSTRVTPAAETASGGRAATPKPPSSRDGGTSTGASKGRGGLFGWLRRRKG